MADGNDNNSGMIPIQRLNEVLEKLAKAEARATAAETSLGKVERTIETANERAKSAEAKLAEASLGYEMDKALLAEGISDEGVVEFVRYKYNAHKVEEGQQKPAFNEWLKEFKESKPAVLAPFQKAAEKPATDPKTQTQAQPPKVVPPRPDGVQPPKDQTINGVQAGKSPTVETNFSPQQLAAMNPKDAIQHLASMGWVGERSAKG